MKKLLFVCTANVCRSPIAAALFNALAEDRGLPFRAESAGIAALEGKPMASGAREALEEIGVHHDGHRARQTSEGMLREADLVLTMGARHTAELLRHFGPSEKVYALQEYATGAANGEISDPYGYNKLAYRASVRQFSEYVERLLDRLEQEEARQGSPKDLL